MASAMRLAVRVLGHPTLADTMQRGLNAVIQAPVVVAGAFGVAYLCWLPLAALCRVLTWLLTTPGVCVLVAALVVLLGRAVAFALVFPCSVAMIAKSLEREAGGAMRAQLGSALAALDALCSALGAASCDAARLRELLDVAGARLAEAHAFHAVLLRQQDDGTLSPHAAFFAHYLGLCLACVDIVVATVRARDAAALSPDRARLVCVVPEEVIARWGGVESSVALPSVAAALPSPPSPANAQLLVSVPPMVALPHLFDARLGAHPRRGDTAALLHCVLNTRDLTLGAALALAHKLLALLAYLSPWLELLPLHRDVIALKELARAAGLPESEAVEYTARRVAGAASAAGAAATAALSQDAAVVPGGTAEAASAGTTARLLILLTGTVDAGLPAAYRGAPLGAAASGGGEVPAPPEPSSSSSPGDAPPPPSLSLGQRAAAVARGARAAGRIVASSAWRAALFLRALALAHRTPTPVAGLDFFRAELLVRFDATQLWVGGNDAVYVASGGGRSPLTMEARLAALAALGLADVAEGIGAAVAARSSAALAAAAVVAGAALPPAAVHAPSRRRSSAASRALASSLSGVGAPEWLIRSCVGADDEGSDDDATAGGGGSAARGATGTGAASRSRAELRALAVAAPAVVLLCNPNAGLYEHAHRSSEWLSIYTALGLDVVVWNYRGYGRSRGWPSPAALRSDAAAIAAVLRGELGARRVIVHGESLGGIAACHLAAVGVADLVIADRTFDTLPRTARAMLGTWAEVALLLVTGWSGSNAAAFTSAAAPHRGAPPPLRLVCTDPKDRVIDWRASLAVGVSSRVLAQRRRAAPEPSLTVGASSSGTAEPSLFASPSRSLRGLAVALLARAPPPRAIGDGGDGSGSGGSDVPTSLRETGSWLFFLVLRLAEDAWPALVRGRVAVMGSPAWAARACAVAGAAAAESAPRVPPLAAAAAAVVATHRAATPPPSPSQRIVEHCLQQHGFRLPPASCAAPMAALWASPEAESPHKLAALTAAAAAGATVAGMFDDHVGAALAAAAPAAAPTHRHGVNAVDRSPAAAMGLAAVVRETSTALHASAALSPLHADGTWAAPTSGAGGQSGVTHLQRPDPLALAALDSDLWAGAAASSTREHAALVALAALAGADNGFGLRLGEAVRDGVAGVEAWAAAAVCWGFALQDGASPLSATVAAAVHVVGASRDAATAADDDVEEEQEGDAADGSAGAARRRGFAQQAPHLLAAGESGIVTAVRRLLAVRDATRVAAPAAAADAGPDCIPADEAMAALLALHALREPCAPPPSSSGAAALGLAAALAAPEGVAVPLTCNHNAAWTRVETSVIARVMLAAIDSWR